MCLANDKDRSRCLSLLQWMTDYFTENTESFSSGSLLWHQRVKYWEALHHWQKVPFSCADPACKNYAWHGWNGLRVNQLCECENKQEEQIADSTDCSSFKVKTVNYYVLMHVSFDVFISPVPVYYYMLREEKVSLLLGSHCRILLCSKKATRCPQSCFCGHIKNRSIQLTSQERHWLWLNTNNDHRLTTKPWTLSFYQIFTCFSSSKKEKYTRIEL